MLDLYTEHRAASSLACSISKKLFRWLVACSCILVMCFIILGILYKLDVVGREFLDLFHLDAERNVPTWFSSMQMAVAGTVCILIYFFKSFAGSQRIHKIFWFSLSIGLFLLSLDELISIHEKFDRGVVFGMQLTMRWVIYFLPFVIIAMILFCLIAFNVLHEHKNIFINLFLGFFIFFSGAMGFEMLKSVIFAANFLKRMPKLRFSIIIMQIISEEWLELIGISLVLSTVTRYFLQEVDFSKLKTTDARRIGGMFQLPFAEQDQPQ